MTDVMVTLAIRGMLAVLLVSGGCYCLWLSGRLFFRRKDSATASTFTFSFGKQKLSFTAGTAGACVAMTSLGWVGAAMWVTPRYDETKERVTVSSLPVAFSAKETSLTAEQKVALDGLVARVRHKNRLVALLEEHAYSWDINSYTEDPDMGVATARAEAVGRYLLDRYGISASRTVFPHAATGVSPPPLVGSGGVVVEVAKLLE
jgi:hypothetical protein